MSESPPDISQFIVCRENCSLRYLEALALNGLVDKVEVLDCNKRRFKKLRLTLIDGSTVESECRFEEEVQVSLRIIASYIGLLRFKRIKEGIKIVKEAKREE